MNCDISQSTNVEQILKHAESNCAACQNQAGAHFESTNLDMAISWFRKAAEQNLLVAKHNLACKLYERGKKVEGRKWFEIAAREKYPASLYYMGVIYELENDVRAISCFKEAATLGNPSAAAVLQDLGL